MKAKSCLWKYLTLLVTFPLLAVVSWAQFTGEIEGTLQDPSGAAIAQAKILLLNTATQVSATTTSDAGGNFRFLSLAPGSYTVTAEAAGFRKAEATVTLQTNQTLNLPISLQVGAITEAMIVTAEAPLVNTAETRTQLTLETPALSSLPLAGRSFTSLVTLAPGVSGLGVVGGGTPGSGVDNYSTETQVDVSANGQGTVANNFIVDGLNVTSAIRQGVLNLTPNPDVIQETNIQVNTFSVEYGGASSILMANTTKSGTDRFHGLASDYFTYQNMSANFSLPGSSQKYAPFHSNNFSFTIGGPIIPHKQFFFFFAAEPQWSSASTGGATILSPDPQFATWAQANLPDTFGTHILNTYAPTGLSGNSVSKTANDIFPGTCGTAATNNLPCDTAMIDSGIFNSSTLRNGRQYFVRIDKYFKNDRIYGSFFRTTLETGGPSPIPQFSSINHTWQRALQVNYTHTFSPTTLNEAIFAQNRIEGKNQETGDFTIPSTGATGISNLDGFGGFYGLGFAQGDFIQHNYHWRDVLTHVRGAHVFRFGYEGWFGDDVEPFQGPWSMPKFQFDNLLNLAQDLPHTEGGVMYNPLTGQQQLWDWNAASKTWGLFAQDTWKARRNLTVTLGFRYDDQGNPYSRSESTVFGNFYLASGSAFEDRVTNGVARPTDNALRQSPKVVNPRVGVAWDVTGKGDWLVRGGFGIYANWLTPANVQEEFRGNPPGLINPTFFAGSGENSPVFVQGTGGKPPFGFTYPPLAGSAICPTAPCLDSKGGIPGASPGIGGINPDLKSPEAYIFSATLERKIGNNFVASVIYSGSHSSNLIGAGNTSGQVSYGVNINARPGDLLVRKNPERLNTSFGGIFYADNNREGNYNGITVDFRGRAKHTFFDASYTHSKSNDDAGIYPTAINPHQFYGPSPWDVPNRFTLVLNYELPGLNGGRGFVGALTGGWGISGTSIYQSGYPFTVFNGAPFSAICAVNGDPANPCQTPTNPAIAFGPGSGDYNADGVNNDYPDVSSYHQGDSRSAFLSGIFTPDQFSLPTIGTNGNEKANQFRNPSVAETDLTAYKSTRITEWLNFQLRFEFFNIFNRPNFFNVGGDQSTGSFGVVQNQRLPRHWQIGAKLTF